MSSGFRRYGIGSLLFHTAIAAALLSEAGLAQDRLNRFRGLCVILTDDLWGAACRVEDKPMAGYQNRFGIVLQPYGENARSLRRERTPSSIKVQASGAQGGIMVVEIEGWGRLWFLPMDPEVRAQLLLNADRSETRRQYFSIIPVRGVPGAVELFIDEPLGTEAP